MSESMNMSVSGIYKKDGKKVISVLFSEGERSAEGYVPEGRIHTNKGFSQEEVAALELYMKSEEKKIFEMAKDLNIMNAFLGKGKERK